MKKRVFKAFAATASSVLFLANQGLLPPSYAQGHVGNTNISAASHFQSVPNNFSPYVHNLVTSAIHNSSPAIVSGVQPIGNGHHSSAAFSTFSSAATSVSNSASHHVQFMHHGQVDRTNANQISQTVIGGYHAGYIFGHHNHDATLTQQISQGSNSLTLHHGFSHINFSNQLALSKNTSYISLSHGHSLNNQSAIALSGSKTSSGLLLGSATLPSLFNLDLSSSQLIIRADNSLPIAITVGGNLSAAGIIVGGHHMLITPGQMLTAAQYSAMEQVITSGQQTLVLSNHGTAISGLITLVAGQIGSLSSIQVPTHVLLDTIGFTSSQPLSVLGTTQILGSVYTLEPSANVTAGLNSGSLFIGTRGTLSENLNSSTLFNNLFAANGVTLSVLTNFTNQGTISSSGSLNLNANEINNISTTNHQAVISAASINLYSNSGNINNSGRIIAETGNIQFNTATAQNININNTNGLIQALAGNISVRDTTYAGNANLNLSGGNWLSKNLDLNSGSGIANANIENVTGTINTNAGQAHITAATQDLIIGNSNLSGDPNYFNTLGSITIYGNLNFSGQDLAIVAANNINAGSGSIDTSSATGNGGSITMIAGANVVSSGVSSVGIADPVSTLTVSGGSATGGYISLNGTITGGPTAITALTSASTYAGSNGGNITLVAYQGSFSNSGSINVPSNITISSGGAGSGNNGNVTIIAGANSGTAINTGNINTTGGTGSSGNINLATQAPVINGASTMTIQNGSITNGTSYTGGATTGNASIVTGNLTSPGGTVNVSAGNSLSSGTIQSNGVGTNGNGGNISLSVGSSSIGSLQIKGDLSANGIGNGNGGNISLNYTATANPLLVGVSGPNSYVDGNIKATAPNSGTGGSINITNAANVILAITLDGDISARGGVAGNLNFTSQANQAIDVSGPGKLAGIINNNSSANAITYETGKGNLTIGNVSNALGNITATTNATNGKIITTQNIAITGDLDLTSGANGSVNIHAITTDLANNINITTPSLIVNPNAYVHAINGNLSIISNGINNALNINLAQGSSIVGSNVYFNASNSGAISVISSFGNILAVSPFPGGPIGNVIFNGGTGAVNVSTNSISGNISGNGGSINLAVANGNITLGSFANGLTSSSGDTDITTSAANGIIQINGSINSAGNVNMTSGNNGSINFGGLAMSSGNTVTINTPNLNVNGLLSQIIANAGNVTILSNGTNNALVVNLGIFSSITSTSGNVIFNSNAVPGSITINSGFGFITANSGLGDVILNGGNNPVNVSNFGINGAIAGTGSAINITVAGGTLTLGSFSAGALSSLSGDINVIAQSPTSNVIVQNLVSSAGNLNITSGNNSNIVVELNSSAQAVNSITFNTPSLTLIGSTSSVVATNGDLNIYSNGVGNALTVNLGSNSLLQGADIVFNSATNPGTVTMTSGLGELYALTQGSVPSIGNIVFNGGNNAINASVDLFFGNIVGTGSNINLTAAQSGITLGSFGGIGLDSLSASGNINVLAAQPGYDSPIYIGNSVTAGGNITLTSGNISYVVVAFFAPITATGSITINTPSITLDGINSSITSTAGNLNILSNGIANALTVNLGNGGILQGQNVNFNTAATAGAITMTNGFGTIAAGPNTTNTGGIIFNGGNGAVNVSVASLNGTLAGNGSTINLTVSSGNINVGSTSIGSLVSLNGDINLLTTDPNGNIFLNYIITSAGNLNVTSGTNGRIGVLNFTTINANNNITFTTPYFIANGNLQTYITATNGNIDFTSSGANNALTASLGKAAIYTGANINFNTSTNPGAITVKNGQLIAESKVGSNILIGDVVLNGGSGAVNVSASSIIGNVAGSGSTINLSTVYGNLSVGSFIAGGLTSSVGNININTYSPTGVISINNLVSSAGNLTITSGAQGSVTESVLTSVFGQTVTINTSVLTLNGFQSTITATTGNLNIQSNGTGYALTVNFGPNTSGMPSALVANGSLANVTFNNTNTGAISITGGSANGLISASNDVILNGGLGAVNTNNQQIIGCIHVNGSSITMQTAIGNLDYCVGIDTSSTNGSGGNITITANGGAINSGAINSSGSGVGNSAGNIFITGNTGITVGNINANGSNGASGGNISLLLPEQTITSTYISATGGGGGNGGSITTTSGSLVLTGANISGNSIDVSASASGNGGYAKIITTSTLPFVIGNGAASGNGTNGNISANGFNGGFIILQNDSALNSPNQIINGSITANGTTGTNGISTLAEGRVLIQGQVGLAPLIVVFNGGLVQASNNANNLGRVGFNGGAGQPVSLLDFGTINGGEFVHVGNLNQITLDSLSQPAGLITISPKITITNNFSSNGTTNTVISTGTTTGTTTGAGSFGFLAGVLPTVTPGPDLSKTATDYTPWGHFFYENFEPRKHEPFKLGIAYKPKNTAYIAGASSYSHSFTGAESDRLAQNGMKLFGSNTENYLNIDKGNILLSPDKPIVVGTHEGSISMSPGAIAFVMESGADVVVYNLRQSAPNQVIVTVNQHKLVLHPGSMMVLTRQQVTDFENIDAECHMVSYHSAQELPIKENGVKAFVAQYSIASALTAVEPLKQLVASSDTQDQAVFNKIVKSAVTLGEFAATIDKEQLANLSRDANDKNLADSQEKIIDSAEVAGKARSFQ